MWWKETVLKCKKVYKCLSKIVDSNEMIKKKLYELLRRTLITNYEKYWLIKKEGNMLKTLQKRPCDQELRLINVNVNEHLI